MKNATEVSPSVQRWRAFPEVNVVMPVQTPRIPGTERRPGKFSGRSAASCCYQRRPAGNGMLDR
jgi:hypothetical protein